VVSRNGNFVVASFSFYQDGAPLCLGRRFNASGGPQDEFQVNSYTTSQQYFPAVALDASGASSWSERRRRSGRSGVGVFGQRFNASGVPSGGRVPDQLLHDGRPLARGDPDKNGNFIVAWAAAARRRLPLASSANANARAFP
jgi:hypothetical protein